MNLQPNPCRPRQTVWNLVETQGKQEQKQGQLRKMYALYSFVRRSFLIQELSGV